MAITKVLPGAFIALLLLAASAIGGTAEQYYNQGCSLIADNPVEAKKYLQESLELQPSFAASYMLGALLLQQGDESAEAFFSQAFKLSENEKEQGLALVGEGECLAMQGELSKGLQKVIAGMSLHPAPTKGMLAAKRALEDENAERVISSKEIQGCLDPGFARGVFVTPKINLPIRFDYNSHKLNLKGRSQTEQLAKALTDDHRSFKVIGHTDVRGNSSYNQALSEKRAMSVIAYIKQLNPGIGSRLHPVGMGEENPLRYEMTEQAHLVNRRVVVEVY